MSENPCITIKQEKREDDDSIRHSSASQVGTNTDIDSVLEYVMKEGEEYGAEFKIQKVTKIDAKSINENEESLEGSNRDKEVEVSYEAEDKEGYVDEGKNEADSSLKLSNTSILLPSKRSCTGKSDKQGRKTSVISFDLTTGLEVQRYPSQTIAAAASCIPYRQISLCCRGKRVNAGGIRWQFASGKILNI